MELENENTVCPVCTLYLRPGITLKLHLTSHPKQKVIDALVRLAASDNKQVSAPIPSTGSAAQPSTSQQWSPTTNIPSHGNHSFIYQQFMSSSSPQPNMPNVMHVNGQQYVTIPTILNPQMAHMMCSPYMYQQQQVIMSTGASMPRMLSIEPNNSTESGIIKEISEEEQEPDLLSVDQEGSLLDNETEGDTKLNIDVKDHILQGSHDISSSEQILVDICPHDISDGDMLDVDCNELNDENDSELCSPDLNKSCQTQCTEMIDETEEHEKEFYSMECSESIPTSTSNTYITLTNTSNDEIGQNEVEVTDAPINLIDIDSMNFMLGNEFMPSQIISQVEEFDYERSQHPKVLTNLGECREMSEESMSVDSANIRAYEHMPARGELSGQESNASDMPWRIQYENNTGVSSYDLLAQETWDASEASETEEPLLQSRNLPTYDDNDIPTISGYSEPQIQYKCPSCNETFNCLKERKEHQSLKHNRDSPLVVKVIKKKVKKLVIKPKKAGTVKTEINFDNVFTNKLKMESEAEGQSITERDNSENVKSEEKPVISNPVICTMCEAVLPDSTALKAHQLELHNLGAKERYKCVMCNETFSCEPKYTDHLQIHPLECKFCGKYFYRRQNMQLHMKRHLGIRPYKCTSCEKSFLTKQKLEEHRNIHTGESPIKCTLCDDTFRRHSNLVQHRNRHHLQVKRKIKDYICSCGEVFHSKKKLAWHKEIHENKPKACAYCSEKFIHMSSLTRHVRKTHNDRFVPKSDRSIENAECPVCQTVVLKSSLECHIRGHSGLRPFTCLICNKDFTTKWNLKLHKWTHASRNAKPFKCNLCKGAFIRESDYTAHMNSHRSLKPYTCNYCGAQFVRKYSCQRHVKEHEKDKTFTCQICGKSFHRSYYLKDHLRVHSGARPFSCHICGKTSTTKSNHNKHLRIHHAREPVSTEN